MELRSKLKVTAVVLLAVLMVVGVIWAVVTRNSYEAELARLRNEIASRDQTIEVQKGQFSKLTLELKDVQDALNKSDQKVKDLLVRLDKANQDILAANQLIIKWKSAYEGLANANQTDVPGDGGVVRKRVDFSRSFGLIDVSGYTLTDPAEAFVRVEQVRALYLTLVLSQDESGAWHTDVTSSDDNTAVDISVAAVNPHFFEPRWYQRLGLSATLAGGMAGTGFGMLFGVGVSYQFKKFDVGPAVFFGLSDRVDRYVGVQATFRPFAN